MLEPTIRKTWAPRGQTPILKCYDRRDRLTVVSALSISPQRRRLWLWLDILDHTLTAEDFDLEIGGIAVMKHAGIRAIGVHPEVSDRRRFEQQSHRVEIVEQTVGRYSERGSRKGRIDEMPFRRDARADAGPDVRPPGGQLFQHENPVELIEACSDGWRREVA